MSEKVVSSVDEQVELNLSDGKITETPPAKKQTKKRPQAPAALGSSVVERLMESVVNNPDADVDKLERVIAIYEKEREDMRRIEFDTHFAIVQSTFDPVKRTKEVAKQDGSKLYDYAPIETIVKAIGKKINDAGFTYYWSEEDLGVQYAEDDQGEKKQLKKMRRYLFHLAGFGYTRTNFVDLPEYVGQDAGAHKLNDGQKRGSSMSYGRRYSMVAGTGVVFEGEDDDGASFDITESLEYAKHIAAMRAAQTGDDMIKAYRVAYKELANDQSGQMKITMVKEQLKREFIAVKKETEDAGRDD